MMAGNRDPYKPNTGCTDERIAKASPVKKTWVIRTILYLQDTAHYKVEWILVYLTSKGTIT